MPQWYDRIEFAAAKVLLVTITALVFVAAIARSVGHPVEWSSDMAQLLFVWLCVFGANKAMRMKLHMAVDYAIKWLPRTPRWILEIINGLMILGFLVTLALAGYRLTMLNWQRIYGDSGLSYAWVTIAIPVGCAIMAIDVIAHMVRSLAKRGPVFFPERSPEIERSHSQLG